MDPTPSRILFRHEQCRGGLAQHHLAVSPAADLAGAQANFGTQADDYRPALLAQLAAIHHRFIEPPHLDLHLLPRLKTRPC